MLLNNLKAIIDGDNLAERRLMKTLHHIRHEKYEVVDYLGEVLKSFKDFVQRPDPKQEYVSQWQIDFNRYVFKLGALNQGSPKTVPERSPYSASKKMHRKIHRL